MTVFMVGTVLSHAENINLSLIQQKLTALNEEYNGVWDTSKTQYFWQNYSIRVMYEYIARKLFAKIDDILRMINSEPHNQTNANYEQLQKYLYLPQFNAGKIVGMLMFYSYAEHDSNKDSIFTFDNMEPQQKKQAETILKICIDIENEKTQSLMEACVKVGERLQLHDLVETALNADVWSETTRKNIVRNLLPELLHEIEAKIENSVEQIFLAKLPRAPARFPTAPQQDTPPWMQTLQTELQTARAETSGDADELQKMKMRERKIKMAYTACKAAWRSFHQTHSGRSIDDFLQGFMHENTGNFNQGFFHLDFIKQNITASERYKAEERFYSWISMQADYRLSFDLDTHRKWLQLCRGEYEREKENLNFWNGLKELSPEERDAELWFFKSPPLFGKSILENGANNSATLQRRIRAA
jgi:hypothetical protein